jgi:hypothetical protein
MFMENFETNISSNLWLTEECKLCYSVNHIFLSNPDANVWECWCCAERYLVSNGDFSTEVLQGYNERF